MSKDNKNVNAVDILGLDDTDADATASRLGIPRQTCSGIEKLQKRKSIQGIAPSPFQKLVASGVLKLERSLDGLQIPPPILEKIGELFDCLDWALSADDE
ncbi:hypothetical protein niasHT_030025 [Heterodera trifolii]|uniref:Uncharacterized protein n=1 Tax=Heterodera trifolii TaxID=157864 RepID=A0ABD2JKZ4_9BILA